MKPSFYLEPDAEKMRSFFRTFSLHEELMADLVKISISKIWIDEAENSWELEYSSPVQPDFKLLDTLSDSFKTSFSLKKLAWKRVADAASSISGTSAEVSQSESDVPKPNPVFNQDVPLEEMPPDEAAQIRKELEKQNYHPENTDPKERQRIAAKLSRRGYSWTQIENAMRHAEEV